MTDQLTFGQYITQKRLVKEISLRKFASMLSISPVYMCNIEKDRRPAPNNEVLEKISALLCFSKEEQDVLYDLAAKSKNAPAVSKDLPDYIMEKDIVRVALRTAKDVDATDEEWQEFIEKLKKRSKTTEEDN
ncbi:helix-turn-helix transcriptional regulator [Paludicola sp. MB14-C6]|uniref:helix-turn-helix domain-containing protein n=1 Tax=Paludihabitans sp. MB14-C6 TaxID=3070656 RepID=UPI0027DAEAAA|nr:helix-turn-helix transcriptional regulator [Paludicola sp. MB14-C6]WMJ22924.1 helix-turn-helix transcriptional regulator [Paludicola sp. MB14-C6]